MTFYLAISFVEKELSLDIFFDKLCSVSLKYFLICVICE